MWVLGLKLRSSGWVDRSPSRRVYFKETKTDEVFLKTVRNAPVSPLFDLEAEVTELSRGFKETELGEISSDLSKGRARE